MLADVRSSGSIGGGDRAVFGTTSPGGILSPLMLVTLASLPTGRDEKDAQGNSSLFDKALVSPAA
jgi:hypothetical protein